LKARNSTVPGLCRFGSRATAGR